ncbi:MAG: ribonuclease H [Candidatus Paceibacterota bacterium]
MKKDIITIYTDGAARGNPGPAGWGAVIFVDGEKFETGGRSHKATNNQMELSGPIGALIFLKKLASQPTPTGREFAKNIEIFSDSKYVIFGITEWIFNWQKNDWRNAAKKPVLNKELWVELYSLSKNFNIKWTYVKGHAGFEWNERADVIATSFADNEPVI